MARILYLAVADARGHLMRAHLVRRLLAPVGHRVDVVTTSEEGQRFLDRLARQHLVAHGCVVHKAGDDHGYLLQIVGL